MEIRFIKISEISKETTGSRFKIRKSSKKFKKLLEDCENAVKSIIEKFKLNFEKEKYWENIDKNKY